MFLDPKMYVVIPTEQKQQHIMPIYLNMSQQGSKNIFLK